MERMETMKSKRWWMSVLLCMLLCVSLIPATAFAAEEYNVLVGGVWITSDNADDVLDDGRSVTYNPDTNTVTLNNATLNGNIYCNTGSTLNIVVNGTNTMDCLEPIATGISNDRNNHINISGAGKLTITVEDITKGSAIRGNNVVIDGVELELHTSGEAISGYPLTIQNGAIVTAVLSEGSANVAVDAGGLKVTGGSTLTATSPLGNSIVADSIEVAENSTVRGTGYYPIMSYIGDITITDSTVTAESTAGWGIWATGNLTIKGKSDVTSTGSIAALGAAGSFTLEPTEGELMDVFAGISEADASAIEGSPLSQTTDLSAYGNQNIKYFRSTSHRHVITLVEKTDPTCTEDGKEAYYACEACGKYFEDQDGNAEIIDLENYGIIEALGHNAVKVKAKAPTETEQGNIEYWYCDRCGKYFEDEELTQEITQEQTLLSATGTATDANIQTGDDADIALWLALMAGAAAAGTAFYSRRKKYDR